MAKTLEVALWGRFLVVFPLARLLDMLACGCGPVAQRQVTILRLDDSEVAFKLGELGELFCDNVALQRKDVPVVDHVPFVH